MTGPADNHADEGREAQPHDRDEVNDSAAVAERLGEHHHRSDDAAGLGTGGDDGGRPREQAPGNPGAP